MFKRILGMKHDEIFANETKPRSVMSERRESGTTLHTIWHHEDARPVLINDVVSPKES